MEVLFYAALWLNQCAAAVESKKAEVFIYAGKNLGLNQLKLAVTVPKDSLVKKEIRALDREYLAYIRQFLKDRETAEVINEESGWTMMIQWGETK